MNNLNKIHTTCADVCGEANTNLLREKSQIASLIYFECSILLSAYNISIFHLNYWINYIFEAKRGSGHQGWVNDWSHTQVSSRKTWFNLPCGKTVGDVLSNLKRLLCLNQSAVPCWVGVGKLGCRTAVPLTPRIWRALHKRGPAHLLVRIAWFLVQSWRLSDELIHL